jgi:hypothetical protein
MLWRWFAMRNISVGRPSKRVMMALSLNNIRAVG